MKNQREIYEALLAGETLIHEHGHTARLDEQGGLSIVPTAHEGGGSGVFIFDFNCPMNWEIYKEPKWYEIIPEGGILCWCWDNHETEKNKRVFVIAEYHSNMASQFRIYNVPAGFDVAKPLTKQEIQVFMDNAPEES